MARRYGVVLTGGIGSGKSTVASIFRKLGAEVIDTDEISHALTGKNGLAIGKISESFGKEYITDGRLDRAKMRKLVFSDAPSKKKLEAILHPMIRADVENRIASCEGPYYLLVVPLFFETNHYRDLADSVLVVDCSETLQVMRTMERSALGTAEVRAIMDSQVPRANRLAQADDILENCGKIEELEAEVSVLHRKYLAENLKNPS